MFLRLQKRIAAQHALVSSKGRREAGFTLIELLVVMIIIAILAAIAIPIFLNQRDKARVSSVQSDLRNASIAAETYYVTNQKYPTDAEIQAAGFYNKSDGVILKATATDGGEGLCFEGSNTKIKGATKDGNSEKPYYYATSGGLTNSTKPCTTATA